MDRRARISLRGCFRTGAVLYIQLLWVSLLGFLIFGEVPDIWTVVGAAFVVASGLYTAHRERVRHSKLVAVAEPSPNP